MPPLLRNGLALLAGLVIGGAVNMALVTLGPVLVPPPPGFDMTSAESLRESIHLLEWRHLMMTFLAHALGTFVGAWVAGRLAATHQTALALGVGAFFLLGGIAASYMFPAPAWFIALDLIVAYIPMAWLAAPRQRATVAPVGW